MPRTLITASFALALLVTNPHAGLAARSPEQLQELMTPFAGVPQEAMVVIFDACRYPNDIMESGKWLAKSEAERGPFPVKQPSVKRLTEQAPQVVTFLSQNVVKITDLGNAFVEQPNDVWLAYGEVTSRAQAQQAATAPPPAATLTPMAAPLSPPATTPAPVPPPQTAAVPPAPAPAPTVVEVQPAPVIVQQPAPTTVVQPAPTTVVQQPVVQESSGWSTTGAALTGGAVGLVGGMALGALINDNNNDDWNGYRPYPVAAPYPAARPYGGAYGGAAVAQRQAVATQASSQRQARATQAQAQRQASATTAQADRQARATQAQADRQARTTQAQSQRQASQAQRQQQTQQRQAQTQQRQAQTQQRQQQAQQRQAARPAQPRAQQASWGGMNGGGRPSRQAGATPTPRASGGGAARAGGGGGGRRAR